jgi:hypothetical protein
LPPQTTPIQPLFAHKQLPKFALEITSQKLPIHPLFISIPTLIQSPIMSYICQDQENKKTQMQSDITKKKPKKEKA